ncbi:MAG: insulinase family protein [Deltaproteobacteria bacterium]|nr:insulinase family protein [Deltaproteobacteria bacterium]
MMKRQLHLLPCATVLLFLASCATSPPLVSPPPEPPPLADPQTTPAANRLPTDPAVTVGKLANGLTYYLRANSQPENRAELQLVVNAGSLLEEEDQRGLAHFVEHMAFNGTENFEKDELIQYVQSIGMRFGADLNAFTTFDETVYTLTVPTEDPQVLETGMQILADWAHGISFEGEEIDKERGVILEERRLRLGAGTRLLDLQLPVLFQGSRYAERIPIGTEEVLENAPYEALRRFYRTWYRPDLMAVVAVGDFEVDAMLSLVETHLGDFRGPDLAPERAAFPVPDHSQALFSIETDPEATETEVAVYTKLPKASTGSAEDYRRSILEVLYHSMFNGRLGEISLQPDPPFLYAGSSGGSFVRSRDVYSLSAAVREGEVDRGLEALLTETRRVEIHGFTETELERTKTDLLRSYEQAALEKDKSHSAGLAAEYRRNFLNQEPIPGIDREVAMVREFLPGVQLEEMNRLADDWITEENRVVLVTGPEKADSSLPDEQQLTQVFQAVKAKELEPYIDRTRETPLLAQPPAPGVVVEEKELADIGVLEWRLANGVKVLLKPTDFKNDQVLISGFSPGGHSLVTDQDSTSATFATTLLTEGGLGDFDQVELEKALTGKVARVAPSIDELEEGVAGGGSPQDLETVLQLIYLYFTAPRADEVAAQSFLNRMRPFVENRSASPGAVFQDEIAVALSQGHPRRRPLSEETLEEVDLQKALAIYRDRFADASDFTFVVVGNFVPSAIRPLVETYLGGLPAIGREESWRDIGVRAPSGLTRVEVRKGLEPKSQVVLIFDQDATWTRQQHQTMATLMDVLQERLREEMREEQGSVYGVSVSGSIIREPWQHARVSISFGCSPDRVETLIATVLQEIRRIQEEGPDETYLTKAQEAQLRQRETLVRENAFWVAILSAYTKHGDDYRLIPEFEALVNSVDAEGVRQAARAYLDTDSYLRAVLWPEETNFVEAAP